MANRKAPAFPLYADDFLAGTVDMTAEEVGVYMRLMCLQWTKGDIGERQMRCVGSDEKTVRNVVAMKFEECEDGRYRNRRLEQVRNSAVEYAERMTGRARAAAEARWEKKRKKAGGAASDATSNAQASHEECPPIPSPSPIPTPNPVSHSVSEEGSSEAAARPSEPPADENPKIDPHSLSFPEFPTVPGRKRGPYAWRLTDEVVRRLREAFPAVDVQAEARKAHAWVMANLENRKTADGMERFLWRWMSRTQDRAPRGSQQTFAKQRSQNTADAIRRFANG